MRKKVKVFTARNYDDEWPDKLLPFIGWLKDHARQIPEEYLAGATIEFDSEVSSVSLEISYARPETEAEASDREMEARVLQESRERDQRALYERLREKYEGRQ